MKQKVKEFFRKLFAKWIDVDLERYENLKFENKKLKSKFKDIESELKSQIEETKEPCKHKEEDINNHWPKDNGLKNIAEAYNRSANTERLIYGQKLQFIKNILEK